MKVHFISIGGSVMHQLAITLKKKGYQVTGSDDEIFEPAASNLKKEGILPEKEGWFPDKISSDLDVVILGMHARADNPELIRAKELGLKIYSFPEFIYSESRDKKRVVVGGSHGKTTTTSMIMHVLRQTGRDFDYLVGAKLEGFEVSVKITDAPVIICEGDEYPASVIEQRPKFHFLHPHIAILTGIAWDHINVFPSFDIYLEQFRLFIEQTEPGGVLIYNETDPVLDGLVREHGGSVRTIGYGIPSHTIDAGVTTIQLEGHAARLKVFGNHNLLNIQAAWLACRELNVPAEDFLAAISGFTGASRRLELLKAGNGLSVYRDFAHAPSKVQATITAVKQQFPDKKLIALLELHTYSSLNAAFLKEYEGAMDYADVAAVFYSRHALEIKRMPELKKEEVQQGFHKKDLVVINNKEDLYTWLDAQHYDNSVLLLMTSGTFEGLDLGRILAKCED